MTEVGAAAAGAATTPAAGFGGGREGADQGTNQIEDADQGGRGNGGGQRGGAQGAQQSPPQGGQQRTSESQDWVKKEETDLFDVVKQRAKRRDELDAKRKERETMKPFQLQSAQSLQ